LRIRGESRLAVEFKKQAEAGKSGLVIAMLEFFHHPVIQMTRRILNLSGSGGGQDWVEA
jgi:hypothetical protein